MFNDFFENEDHAIGRCYGCSDCHIVSANGGWSFYGCYCAPYHGKWVAEVKNCPKGKAEDGSLVGKLIADSDGCIRITHWMPLPEPPKEELQDAGDGP